MNKRWNLIILTCIFLLSYIYSCLYFPLSYAKYVEDKEPDEPIIFERNDPTINIITSEDEIEKYRKDPFLTQRILIREMDYTIVHRFYKLWEATCQHVAHDEWNEFKIY